MNEEIEQLIENSSRPPADRTMPYVKAAECLEMLGTSRADFRHLSDEQRIAVGRHVVIHLTRKKVDGPIVGRETEIFFHLTGRVGIDFDETIVIWREVIEGDTTMDDIHETYDGE